jgi:hypothetical protein
MGLFGATFDATIENLIVKDFNYRFLRNIGGLTGYMDAGTTITNVAVNGDIETFIPTGSITSGGLIGRRENAGSSITRCSAVVDINVTNRSAVAIVSCGGLIGAKSPDNTTDCYSQGTITGQASYNMQDAGAFVSNVSQSTPFKTVVTRCYSATQYAANLTPYVRTGGFVGDIDGTAETVLFDNHWDQTLNPTLEDIGDPAPLDRDGIDAETTAAMYAQATYTNWDFGSVWEIVEGVSYPTHQWSTSGLGKIRSVCQAV